MGVYCRGISEEKVLLFKKLEECKNRWKGMWVLGGDFNMVLRCLKRSDECFSSVCANEFKEEMYRLNLMDLPLTEGNWMWTNQRSRPSCLRIDHFLISHDCLLQFASLRQNVLQRPISDYFPICLASDGIFWGHIPFRFDNKWLKVEGFRSMVENRWKDMLVVGNASFRIAKKLVILKAKIKKRMREEEGKAKECTNKILKGLEKINTKEGEWELTENDLDRRELLIREVANKIHIEEISWKQKTGERWLKEGDRNTKYFHCLASYRRTCNYMEELLIDSHSV